MATVRINQYISAHVRHQFYRLYQDRLLRKEEELQHLDIGNFFYSTVVPEKYRKLAEELNTDVDGGWIDCSETINVRMVYHKDVSEPMKQVAFRVPFKPPIPLPDRYRKYGYIFTLKPEMAPYEHAKKIFLELDALTEERDKLITQIVDGVLVNCSTLRQVLELWPTALDFMPDDAKKRHMQAPEKRQTATIDVVVDDDVKVSLMKARLLKPGN